MTAPVLFVAWQSRSLANGGIQSLTEILRGLAGRVERIVITLSDGPATELWRSLGCEVHVWEAARPGALHGAALALSRARRLPGVLAENVRLARFVRARGVRVVHCNDVTAFWFAAPGARVAGARVIFNVRDMFPPEATYGPRWRGIHLLADHIVCLSAGMRDEVLERMSLPRALQGRTKQASVGYIYSAVDLERMHPADPREKAAARAALGLPQDRIVISNVGAFCEKKNQLGFIERVVPRLVAEIPSVVVFFAGDFDPARSAYAATCLARANALGISGHVVFHGFVQDASSVYRASDLTALSSRYEGLPRCMIESLACGVPMVSFDVTSVREFLELRDTGVAIRWGDYDAMATALARLAGSPDEARRLGERARAVAVDAFDRDRSVARYEALYEALGAAASRDPGRLV